MGCTYKARRFEHSIAGFRKRLGCAHSIFGQGAIDMSCSIAEIQAPNPLCLDERFGVRFVVEELRTRRPLT